MWPAKGQRTFTRWPEREEVSNVASKRAANIFKMAGKRGDFQCGQQEGGHILKKAMRANNFHSMKDLFHSIGSGRRRKHDGRMSELQSVSRKHPRQVPPLGAGGTFHRQKDVC